jgi:hypothetical protein
MIVLAASPKKLIAFPMIAYSKMAALPEEFYTLPHLKMEHPPAVRQNPTSDFLLSV